MLYFTCDRSLSGDGGGGVDRSIGGGFDQSTRRSRLSSANKAISHSLATQ